MGQVCGRGRRCAGSRPPHCTLLVPPHPPLSCWVRVSAFHQRRWRAAEHRHPTGRERMGSTTVQILQDPIVLLPRSASICFRGGGCPNPDRECWGGQAVAAAHAVFEDAAVGDTTARAPFERRVTAQVLDTHRLCSHPLRFSAGCHKRASRASELCRRGAIGRRGATRRINST